jgi:hypothetical protein
MTPVDKFHAVVDARGYEDIDPENLLGRVPPE